MENKKVIIAKPQTFMNDSGKTVKSLASFYKVNDKNILIVQDDIDLETGTIKISIGRGSAGHKGIESVIRELGANNFARIRIGIEPEDKTKKALELVLKGFDKKEKERIDGALDNTCLALETAVKGGLERAMQEFNK